MEEDPAFSSHPIADEVDHQILMHRDAHFGGNFPLMIDYYEREGKGVQPDFTLKQIKRLAEVEKEFNQNLAAMFLSAHEATQVADARETYLQLKELYEKKSADSQLPKLIADLILSEDEQPENEINAILTEKIRIVPLLIDLIKSEKFYDPLSPGYGLAPFLAIECLERIGDKRAIIALFETIGKGDFFGDDQAIHALKTIGEPAKQFLLKVISGKKINEDNEKAAIALMAFCEDEEVANRCFELLLDPDFQSDPCLASYLALGCAGLKDAAQQKSYQTLARSLPAKSMLKQDMEAVIKEQGW